MSKACVQDGAFGQGIVRPQRIKQMRVVIELLATHTGLERGLRIQLVRGTDGHHA